MKASYLWGIKGIFVTKFKLQLELLSFVKCPPNTFHIDYPTETNNTDTTFVTFTHTNAYCSKFCSAMSASTVTPGGGSFIKDISSF